MKRRFLTAPSVPAVVCSSVSHDEAAWMSLPWLGDLCAIAAWLAFFVTAILLPLVGKAGATTPWAAQNAKVFGWVSGAALALASLAALLKIVRHRRDGSPFPRLSIVLVVLTASVWTSFHLGLLSR